MNSPLDTSKPARVETVLVLDDAKGTTVLCQLGLPRTLPSSRATKFKVAPSAIKNGAIWAAAGADDFFCRRILVVLLSHNSTCLLLILPIFNQGKLTKRGGR